MNIPRRPLIRLQFWELAVRTCLHQSTVEIDDLIVEPFAWLEPTQRSMSDFLCFRPLLEVDIAERFVDLTVIRGGIP